HHGGYNLSIRAGTQVENEPAAYKGLKEITPIRGPFAAPAGLFPSQIKAFSSVLPHDEDRRTQESHK
ncbi:MAG: hypothetical protein KA818_10115, partial [Methanoculleus sp.]|nr:hypothetical protein [Methanoculleus sp.]